MNDFFTEVASESTVGTVLEFDFVIFFFFAGVLFSKQGIWLSNLIGAHQLELQSLQWI